MEDLLEDLKTPFDVLEMDELGFSTMFMDSPAITLQDLMYEVKQHVTSESETIFNEWDDVAVVDFSLAQNDVPETPMTNDNTETMLHPSSLDEIKENASVDPSANLLVAREASLLCNASSHIATTQRPTTRKRNYNRKTKLYELQPLSDPGAEQKRKNAIKAHKNRSMQKDKFSKLEVENLALKQTLKERDELIVELKDKIYELERTHLCDRSKIEKVRSQLGEILQ